MGHGVNVRGRGSKTGLHRQRCWFGSLPVRPPGRRCRSAEQPDAGARSWTERMKAIPERVASKYRATAPGASATGIAVPQVFSSCRI